MPGIRIRPTPSRQPEPRGQILIGLTGLYESTNQGDIVTNISPKDAAGNNLLVGNVTALVYGVDNPDAAYVATSSGQLFQRTSPGATFHPISVPWLTGVSAKRIVVDPNEVQIAYVLDSYDRVWARAIDGSWTELDGSNIGTDAGRLDLLSGDVRTLEIYNPPGSPPGGGVILAGGLGGVFRLILGPGVPYWRAFGQGLPDVVVNDLHYVPSDGDVSTGDMLIVGTLGRGAWTEPVASAFLDSPGSLTVRGDDGGVTNDTIVLRLDPNNPRCCRSS